MSPPPEIPPVDLMRRRLSLTTALLAATPLGWARPSAPTIDADMGAGTQNTSADLVANKSTRAGELLVSHVDLGPPDGQPVLLLHGWPYDIQTYAEATRLLVRDGYRVIVPYLRGHGRTSFLFTSTPRNGQQSVLARDAIALLDALRIKRAIIGGCDWGARTANVIAALWPERCDGLVSVSGYLIGGQDAGRKPLPPESVLSWWYQFYFATERGRIGYAQNRREFARLIWRLASPRWRFDDATFDKSASALENPDHVAVVIHNYRWRLGLVSGDPTLAGIEARLSKSPLISTPSITLEGDANGAPHPLPESYAGKFTGPYEHRNVIGGIGHNLPQEAPVAFAKAIQDVTSIGAG